MPANDADERREQFGANVVAQNELADLIVAGRKRATSSLARMYGEDGLRLPTVGATWLVEDGERRVRCRCRTTHVELRAFGDVDEDHAAAEGGGDGTLKHWRITHRAFFEQQGALDHATLLVLERFELCD